MQISGKKPKPLAGFDRRARQHDAVDLLLHQGLDGHRHAEISLAGSRRANAEHDVALLNHFDILALHRGFRRDLFLTGRTETRAREVVAQAVRAVFGDLCESFA